MPDFNDETLGRIEATQAALRDSIEKAKALASQSERLIRQHRDEMRDEMLDETMDGSPAGPAEADPS